MTLDDVVRRKGMHVVKVLSDTEHCGEHIYTVVTTDDKGVKVIAVKQDKKGTWIEREVFSVTWKEVKEIIDRLQSPQGQEPPRE